MLTDKIKQLDEETNGEISESIKEQKFKPIIKNGVWIGFVCFQEKWQDNQRHVFLKHMYIEPKYRNMGNLLFLRKFFKDLYKRDYRFVFWHNGRRDRFYYADKNKGAMNE